MKRIENCRYCDTDEIYIGQHSGWWKVRCDHGRCLVVQCCATKAEAISRWNEINLTTKDRGLCKKK